MRLLLLPFLMGTLCLAVADVPAQGKKDDAMANMPKPGAEHKILETLTGTYDCKVKAFMGPGEPQNTKGAVVRKMLLGGRYLHEDITGSVGGMEFLGKVVVGYDVAKKKYVTAMIDNFSTGIQTSTGSYDAATKTFTFHGQGDNPAMGGKFKTRDTLKIVSDTEQVMEMYKTAETVGAKEMKMMEITLTKKK